MSKITVFGKGNMGSVIGELFTSAGHEVSYITSQDAKQDLADLIIFAVPFPAVEAILDKYAGEFSGKVIVDISNPLNFETFDSLVVPADSSAAQVILDQVPEAKVVKAFNTNFATTLQTKKVGETVTTVLAAGEADAKAILANALEGTGLNYADAGELKRARELEAIGFLQMTLAVSDQIGWTAGFALNK